MPVRAFRLILAFCLGGVFTSAFAPPTQFLKGWRQVAHSQALDATILDTVSNVRNFGTLNKAIDAAGLRDALNGPGPFTLFAPNDEAFAKLPAGTLEALLKDKKKLADILKFHVHNNKMTPNRTGRTMDTLLMGEDGYAKQLTVKLTNWTCISFLFGGHETPAQVLASGVTKWDGTKCDNGLIHEINQVMLPYEGNDAPKITFIGFGGITEPARLQLDYYGPEQGKGRNTVGTLDADLDSYKRMSEVGGWKEGCNYELPINDKGETRLG